MSLRPLRHEDTAWLHRLASQDPAQHVYLLSLLEITRTAQLSSAAGTMFGFFEGDEPTAAYWVGGTIISIGATPRSNAAVARMLNQRGRFSCSLIGDHLPVLDLFRRLDWGAPRGLRDDQPLLVADREPDCAADPAVRLGTPADEPAAFPASVAMFTEEVGFSPLEHGSAGYRGRVRSNLLSGSTLLITSAQGPDGGPVRRWPADGGQQVVFKADLGIRSQQAVQVQGVWVHPDFRGRGLAAPGMVAVTQHVQQHVAPIVSLYVNAFNAPARRSYERAGFSQVGRFATVIY